MFVSGLEVLLCGLCPRAVGSVVSGRRLLWQEAFLATKETILYLPAIVQDKSRPDYLVTVDVDPSSSQYSQVPLSNDLIWEGMLYGLQNTAAHNSISSSTTKTLVLISTGTYSCCLSSG